MDTSKLNNSKKCIGGILIFSGRPDPFWSINEKHTKKLKEIWNSLNNFSGKLPVAPLLGYRGCFLQCSTELEFFAYNGFVTLKSNEEVETRSDKNRVFEKFLLSTAPEGTLPDNIFIK